MDIKEREEKGKAQKEKPPGLTENVEEVPMVVKKLSGHAISDLKLKLRSLIIKAILEYQDRDIVKDSVERSKLGNHHKIKKLLDNDESARKYFDSILDDFEENLVLKPFVVSI